MSDLIKRQDAIDAICTWDKFGVDERCRLVRWHEGLEPYVHLRDVVVAIENLPSAEPQIIRCKDCMYYHPSFCKMWSLYGTVQTAEDFYCGYAERRKDAD